MSKNMSIVTTTVTVPDNLPQIYDNAIKHDHDIHLYIVGDNITPSDQIRKYLISRIPKENWTYLSIRDQKGWLNSTFGRSKSKVYRNVFQENNYQRRIIGFLIATQEGSDKIIAVDTDNYPHPDTDFVGTHDNIIGKHDEMITCMSSTTYVNLLDFLDKETSIDGKLYVRGYPIHLRGPIEYIFSKETSDVAVNVGLWSKSPDMEALSRLSYGDIQISYRDNMFPIAIADGCYTSMCLQNISFDSKYLITQYEFPMNVPIGGIRLGRYDDIWAGYICKKILDHNNKDMTFGSPMAIHERHIHDFQKDFINEFWGMYANMFFYSAIRSIILDDYKNPWSNFTEVILKLRNSIRFLDHELSRYFDRVWNDAMLWAKMIDELKLG